jgi:general secretion pathway protein H
LPSTRDARAGVTLIETMFALVLVALVAALALPWTLPGRGALSVEAQAVRVAALLRADRNAALRSGRTVATTIDLATRTVHSGAGPGRLVLPPHLALRAEGAERVEFRPDGTSSGGSFSLAAAGATAVVSINPGSAAVTLAAR